MSRRSTIVALPMLFGALTAAHGQLVTPKTVPVRQDEQFAITPSARTGMANVSLALDDTIGDPFANPSKASSLRGTTMFASPFTHGITDRHGGGRTLPFGALASHGKWSGGLVVAFQDLNHSPSSNPVSAGSSVNRYGTLVVARRFRDDLAIGASASGSRIHSLDGVDLLYVGSRTVQQSGTVRDFRVGATKWWGERRLEGIVVTNVSDMTHDVDYPRVTIDQWPNPPIVREARFDHNSDRTSIWGGHLQYAQPMGEGWRLGWLATMNKLTHPHIPDYVLQSAPTVRRDPGATYAYAFGLGVGRAVGLSSFGIDLIQEPMTSDTWGVAERDTAIAGGGTLRAGERTVDNHFSFANWKLRMGFGHDFVMSPDSSSLFGFQIGLGVSGIDYDLRQENHVSTVTRNQHQDWSEWSPTLGFRWKARGLELRYNYRRTCSMDCINFPSGDKITAPPPTIIAAPTQFLTTNGGTSRMHQLMLTMPIK